jgi:MFS family permease
MNNPPEPRSASPTLVRYGVLGFVCSLSLLTYLDRICIMRVKNEMAGDLQFDDVQMGLVFAAFAVGYALFEVPGGWMGDVWGARRVITRIVLWWSLFTALTGLVWHFTPLDSGVSFWLFGNEVALVLNALAVMVLVRFLFGCGEAGAYPNLARVTGSWFPYRERALAQGAIWMSARFGGAIAPLVIGRLTVLLGWRQAFWVLGAIGAVWCIVFWWWFRDTPEQHPAANDAERDLIRAGPYSWQAQQAGLAHGPVPWGRLLALPSLWAMCVASAGVSFSWYFYPTWQPKYLEDVFGISYADSELLTGLPFACGAVGALLGGKLSDLLVHRIGRRWGRSLVGLVGFAGAGLCVLATGYVREAWQAVTLLCLAFFINDLAIPPIWAACADIGGRHAGTLSGFMNMAGGVGAVLGPALTPRLLALGLSWREIFILLAAVWFVAALAWLGINAGKPLEPPHSNRS